MWAAAQKHPEVVRLLLAAGADVKARSRAWPQTVVSEQTQRAGREKLNYTVMRGGSTALLFTARTGDAESAKLLLEFGADVNDSLADGTPALTLAAHSGQTGVGIALLEKGAEPNAMGAGYAPLHAAVLRGDLTLVKALLARGADPNLRMVKGTPVRRDTMDYNLLPPLVGSTPYLLAARFVEGDILRALKEGGADPNLAMPNGATPLLLAAGLGANSRASRRGISLIDFGKVEPESKVYDAVKAVIESGADVNAASQSGDTPLHAAAALGYTSVVQLLADKGAQINAKNRQGQTPLKALLSSPGRRRVVADDDDAGPARNSAHPETAALLRKLGATE
jgi:ankyrin repeat protein